MERVAYMESVVIEAHQEWLRMVIQESRE
ncbi:hypothetical protein E2C01_064400 [Portunus trituberculatus]|uniref:Uncharacterized protein n=1 Tax=Portunus trituberculatus TaxID=210409 RepID=A0A5B7HCX1_PORTR|nr:hypothetical protein [Portunus trituberculatus]